MTTKPAPRGEVNRRVVLSMLLVLYSLVGLSIGLALLDGKAVTVLTVVYGSQALLGVCTCTYVLAVPPEPPARDEEPPIYFYSALFETGSFRFRWRLVDRDALAALPFVLLLMLTCCGLPIAALFTGPPG